MNAPDRRCENQSALLWAIAAERDDLIRLLLGRHDVNVELKAPDNFGNNALTLAALYGSHEIVRLLIEDGRISIDSTNDTQSTALIIAAEEGYENVVELLLDSNANPNTRDSYGGAALLRAINSGRINVVQILVSCGTDCTFRDGFGRGLLHGCAVNRRGVIMQYLLENVDDLDINCQGDRGETPLHDAVRANSYAVAKVPLEHGARTDVKDNKGRTPLGAARDLNSATMLPLLHMARTKEIVNNDTATDPARHAPRRNSTLDPGYIMPLHSAVRFFSEEDLVTYLDDQLLSNANLADERNESKDTPLHVAADYGRLANMQLLLDRGADLNIQNQWGWTPLHLAIDFNYPEIVELLLDRGCEVDTPDLLDRTPLNFAIVQLNRLRSECAMILLQRNARCTNIESWLVPILSHVVDMNDLEVVQKMVQGGMPFQLKDRDRLKPYQRAKQLGHTDIEHYFLRQLGKDKHRYASSPDVPRLPSGEVNENTNDSGLGETSVIGVTKENDVDVAEGSLNAEEHSLRSSTSLVRQALGELPKASGISHWEPGLLAVIVLLLAMQILR